MACSCKNSIGMKKKHKVSGSGGNDLLMEIIHDTLPGVGMVVAHEGKNYLPESIKTSLGDNAGMIINGAGILLGLGAPHLLNGKAKSYARAVGSGIAGQCLYSMYASWRGNTSIAGRDNNSYALAAKKEALRKKLQAAVAGRDNNSYALAGAEFTRDAGGLYGKYHTISVTKGMGGL